MGQKTPIKRITENRYNSIQQLLKALGQFDNVKVHDSYICKVMGVSDVTLWRIKKTATFAEYQEAVRAVQAHKKREPAPPEQQTIAVHHGDYTAVQSRVDAMHQEIADLAERLRWLEANAVIGSKKRWLS